jgi:hypothetical protein
MAETLAWGTAHAFAVLVLGLVFSDRSGESMPRYEFSGATSTIGHATRRIHIDIQLSPRT